jgi:hypothetical protein
MVGDVLFYGVVSTQTEKAVEFFLERDAAEAMIREVREDEPLLAIDLRVEAIETRLGLHESYSGFSVISYSRIEPTTSSPSLRMWPASIR